MWWRLLECLQQRVEAVRREHVHLVDEIHLEATACGRELHVVHQVASLVDFGPRCRIHFDEVDKTTFIQFITRSALAARQGGHPGFAVQTLREDTRDRGLANPARPREQIGVMQAVRRQRIGQSAHDVILADHFVEPAWPIFAG